jgi:hypothetical protein
MFTFPPKRVAVFRSARRDQIHHVRIADNIKRLWKNVERIDLNTTSGAG